LHLHIPISLKLVVKSNFFTNGNVSFAEETNSQLSVDCPLEKRMPRVIIAKSYYSMSINAWFITYSMPFFQRLGHTKESVQVQGTLKHFITIKKNFYSEGLLATCTTPKLEDHPLSAVHYCLFNIFTQKYNFFTLP
jgi:hypothetical protein